MKHKNEFGTQMKNTYGSHTDTDTHTGWTCAISEKYAAGTVYIKISYRHVYRIFWLNFFGLAGFYGKR